VRTFEELGLEGGGIHGLLEGRGKDKVPADLGFDVCRDGHRDQVERRDLVDRRVGLGDGAEGLEAFELNPNVVLPVVGEVCFEGGAAKLDVVGVDQGTCRLGGDEDTAFQAPGGDEKPGHERTGDRELGSHHGTTVPRPRTGTQDGAGDGPVGRPGGDGLAGVTNKPEPVKLRWRRRCKPILLCDLTQLGYNMDMLRHLIALSLLAAPCAAQPLKLGAMGDSLTDEYAEESYSYAKNWLEQVRNYRGIDIGPTATEAGQPGNTWGEPRRKFYKYNWARAGASTVSTITGGQAAGIAGHVNSDGVMHGVLQVGANDFNPTSAAFSGIYNASWTQTQIDNYVTSRLSNMATIIDTSRATGLNLAVCTFVDYAVAPTARALYSDPVKRERVTVVVKRINDGIHELCRARKVPVIELYGLTTAIFGTNFDLHPYLWIGGQQINLNQRDTASNTLKLAGFVHDNVHPHTTVQGVFANVMLTTANICWGEAFVPFSEEEILSHAGVAYLGTNQLAGQIGSYADYVTNYACLADADKSGFVDIDDYVYFVSKFEQGDDAADFDGTGFVDIDDFVAFVGAFEQGC
jgi:hypothetical protein